MAGQFVTVEKFVEGYALITICKEPVNSMNRELWQQLGDALTACEKDRGVRGVILASGLKKDIFTAGNDITELYAPKTSEENFRAFWAAQTTCLARLYRSPLVTIAAVRGYCPAGGCILSLCCDARVVTEDCRMGLNEVALGIPVPKFWVKIMVNTVGGPADALLQAARFVGAAQAKAMGMVDEVVPKAELLAAATAEVKRRIAFPDPGRVATKHFLRKEIADAWLAYSDEEAASGWKGLSDPSTVKALGGVLAKLGGSVAKAKL